MWGHTSAVLILNRNVKIFWIHSNPNITVFLGVLSDWLIPLHRIRLIHLQISFASHDNKSGFYKLWMSETPVEVDSRLSFWVKKGTRVKAFHQLWIFRICIFSKLNVQNWSSSFDISVNDSKNIDESSIILCGHLRFSRWKSLNSINSIVLFIWKDVLFYRSGIFYVESIVFISSPFGLWENESGW